ncbi:MAG: hypothetical protein V7K50_22030 [Nostoc sp.]|uniref:hypothetical protein n=1 Tax=Nostoc sp. TaxID=1180 RepID=UPI002FFC2332
MVDYPSTIRILPKAVVERRGFRPKFLINSQDLLFCEMPGLGYAYAKFITSGLPHQQCLVNKFVVRTLVLGLRGGAAHYELRKVCLANY